MFVKARDDLYALRVDLDDTIAQESRPHGAGGIGYDAGNLSAAN